jgi:hypothetical protein
VAIIVPDKEVLTKWADENDYKGYEFSDLIKSK